jgi:ABC-type oligopeptide transport system ATPase subunit
MGYRKIGNWSHDIAVAGRVSHRVAVMYLDEIVEMGPHSQTILRQSAAPSTRRSLSAVPIANTAHRYGHRLTRGDKAPRLPSTACAPPEPSSCHLVKVGNTFYR